MCVRACARARVCVRACVRARERDVEGEKARAVGCEILNGEATPEDSLWSDATGLVSLE